jgi:hypothetical protein
MLMKLHGLRVLVSETQVGGSVTNVSTEWSRQDV